MALNNQDPSILVQDINTQIGLNGKTGLPLKYGIGRRDTTEFDLKLKLREQDKD